jgi:hypothetical protein
VLPLRSCESFSVGCLGNPQVLDAFRGVESCIFWRADFAGSWLTPNGGRRPAHLPVGYYIEPAVSTGVTNDMAIARDEILWPVLSIIDYFHGGRAIRLANDSDYGLVAACTPAILSLPYCWLRSCAPETCAVNDAPFAAGGPFGGHKASDLGRYAGPEGLQRYLQVKSIALPKSWPVSERQPRHEHDVVGVRTAADQPGDELREATPRGRACGGEPHSAARALGHLHAPAETAGADPGAAGTPHRRALPESCLILDSVPSATTGRIAPHCPLERRRQWLVDVTKSR